MAININRLTSNKDTADMTMYELAHNSCCINENGKAVYRDYDTNTDARALTVILLDIFADIPNGFECDDDFDEFMLDSLQYGIYNIEGLIATFYQNLWAMAELRECLKEYEDLEEQGRLVKLPCATDDTVWYISEKIEKKGRKKVTTEFVEKGTVNNITFSETMIMNINVCNDENIWTTFEGDKDFGKIIFLTKEEAETALKERN